MYSMFNNCKSLTSIDLTNFNIENNTNMGFMFSCCSSLTSIDVSNINIKKFKKIVSENLLKLK